jgi:hypothetical protein
MASGRTDVPEVNAVSTQDDKNRIAAYLARRDEATLSPEATDRADLLVLCGSAVLAAVDVAAAALHDGLVERLLVTGGVGHSTEHLRRTVREDPRFSDVPTRGRPESAILADLLRRHFAVPASAVSTEERSAHCGENADFSVDLLLRSSPEPQSILLVQDPTMQRRTHECFVRALRGVASVRVISYAPFVPTVTAPAATAVTDDAGRVVWSMTRFTSLLLGEMGRLHDDEHGYGPQGAGFIDHVDIPRVVMDAYRRLAAAHPESTREAWQG